jgi:hypothetical protein
MEVKNIATLFLSFLRMPLKIVKNAPLAPKPNNAILTIINAKWYHIVTENILAKDTSSKSVDKETKTAPI